MERVSLRQISARFGVGCSAFGVVSVFLLRLLISDLAPFALSPLLVLFPFALTSLRFASRPGEQFSTGSVKKRSDNLQPRLPGSPNLKHLSQRFAELELVQFGDCP